MDVWNELQMQAGRVAAARPASARAASLVAGISGGPHHAASLLRTLRQPACIRQPAVECADAIAGTACDEREQPQPP
jgi:hypothetical protein